MSHRKKGSTRSKRSAERSKSPTATANGSHATLIPANGKASSPPNPTERAHVRVVLRDSAGVIHLDCPPERLPEIIKVQGNTTWIDIVDPEVDKDHAAENLLRDVFGFHPLAIEDALKETHVPKVDDWGEYLYIVFHSIDFDPETDEVRLHELDIFLGKNFLVTYHTLPLAFLDCDRRNIERDPENRLRHGPDHLLYHFLDLAVADYMPAIEHLDNAIDDAQEEVFHRPTPETLKEIFRIKRSTLKLHRVIAPEREVLNRLARDVYAPITEEHRVYFRDVYDHLVRTHDLTEGLRDLITGALDTYLSAISNRTNDIMKALTLVTVMFMPMSFLTGFFGMNYFGETLAFQRELPKRSMFLVTCLLMAASFLGQWGWARYRRWL